MRLEQKTDWSVSPEEAIRVQKELRSRVLIADDFPEVRIVCGIDVGLSPAGMATGGVVALSFPELRVIEQVTASVPLEFPYIPGLLSFREAPAILAALAKLSVQPSLLILDGQGIAHPRRFGIASHIGVITDTPSIGCAKSRLIGTYTEPGPRKGDSTPLLYGSEQIGTVLRTRDNTRPVFVSPGHRVSLDSAVELVLRTTAGYRLPEPTRLAHQSVSKA
jgi:deoxyribonuclease V